MCIPPEVFPPQYIKPTSRPRVFVIGWNAASCVKIYLEPSPFVETSLGDGRSKAVVFGEPLECFSHLRYMYGVFAFIPTDCVHLCSQLPSVYKRIYGYGRQFIGLLQFNTVKLKLAFKVCLNRLIWPLAFRFRDFSTFSLFQQHSFPHP